MADREAAAAARMTDRRDAPVPAAPAQAAWHAMTAAAVAERLGTTPAGLAAEEAAHRLAQHGPNALHEQARRGPLAILLGQFTDLMIVLLLVAAAISGAIGEPEDAIAIIAIVLLNGVIGFVQEYRAERALRALKQLAAPRARVLRDGQAVTVPAAELVPGDVVLLEAGSIVPADLRLTEAAQLRTEEAALTGESQTVEKGTAPVTDAAPSLGDRTDMAFSGTVVTHGRGSGIAVGTGMDTELGRIASLLASTADAKTPLQRRLGRFGRQLSVVAIGLCALVFVLGLARGEPPALMLLTAVSLAVAAVPEALPAVATIALALGAQRLVRQNALIRHLPAVETLGSVTFICSDKTGTLTQNRMRVEALVVEGERQDAPPAGAAAAEPWPSLFRAMAVSNDADPDGEGALAGDPTEVALHEAAGRAGYGKAELAGRLPRIAELPFDSERKCMTTLHRDGDGIVAFTKGAPERILEHCSAQLTASGPQPVDAAALLRQADALAAAGLRVLAFARRDWPALPEDLSPAAVERGLTLIGLVGMMDPPRPEAARAVEECRTAGITPVMITGDHPLTAAAIASRLGILPEAGGRVVTGRELAGLSDDDLAAQVAEIRVYARVDPAQKIRIVRALQDRGAFVAMTGDGVNDAPAVKRADIGVAMGRTGTDVTREASDMVLLDDNFATVVNAVREGRRIYDNIRKFIRFVLAGNMGEILTLLTAPFLGLPLPLLPVHLLWINLVTDGLPGLALAAEPAEKGIMRRPAHPPGESIFARGLGYHVVWVGVLIAALSVLTQAWAMAIGSEHWQTMVFAVLTFSQLFHVMAIHVERESVFRAGLGSNLPLLGAVLLGAALQLAVIYVPALNEVLKTQPLTAGELAFCMLLPSTLVIAIEVEKWLRRRRG